MAAKQPNVNENISMRTLLNSEKIVFKYKDGNYFIYGEKENDIEQLCEILHKVYGISISIISMGYGLIFTEQNMKDIKAHLIFLRNKIYDPSSNKKGLAQLVTNLSQLLLRLVEAKFKADAILKELPIEELKAKVQQKQESAKANLLALSQSLARAQSLATQLQSERELLIAQIRALAKSLAP